MHLQNISSLSVKYFDDTLNSNEYFFGNNMQLPDSCIIFEKDNYQANEDIGTSTLLFYFFSEVKPKDLNFRIHQPLSEKKSKINDSIWVYKSVQEVISIH